MLLGFAVLHNFFCLVLKTISVNQKQNVSQSNLTLPTYITVLEHFVHVDALCVENSLFLSGLCCGFAQQAACQASGLHDDGVLGQC